MLFSPSSLHFSVPEVSGLAVEISGKIIQLWTVRVEGVVLLEGEELRFQFDIRDKHQPYAEVREVRVPLAQIDSIHFHRRWFKPARLQIRVRDLALLKHAPGSRGATLTLLVVRTDRLRAEELISSASLAAAQLEESSAPELPLPA